MLEMFMFLMLELCVSFYLFMEFKMTEVCSRNEVKIICIFMFDGIICIIPRLLAGQMTFVL